MPWRASFGAAQTARDRGSPLAGRRLPGAADGPARRRSSCSPSGLPPPADVHVHRLGLPGTLPISGCLLSAIVMPGGPRSYPRAHSASRGPADRVLRLALIDQRGVTLGWSVTYTG